MEFLRGIRDGTRLVVSEPLGDLPGVWNELPESSYAVAPAGSEDYQNFRPEAP